MNSKSEASKEKVKLPTGQLSVYKEKDIFFAGYVGLSGTRDIILANREKLLERYPAGFLDEICGGDTAKGASALSETSAILYEKHCGKGGILEALYLMCKELSLGIYVDLQAVPVLWQTVEMGEYFEKNPYAFASSGCILGIASNFSEAKLYYEAKGLNIELIGRTTSDNAKILKRGEEEGNLNRPGRN